MEENGSLEGMT